MSAVGRRGPVRWGELTEEILADLWDRTCKYRAAHGEPQPPEHLNPIHYLPEARSMKAIETRYAGHRFRSRLEARYAVFFDQLGIRWQYEPQGFEFAGRKYLPDFLLPDTETWVEVKGDEATLDYELMESFAYALPRGARVVLLGPLPDAKAPGDWDWAWQALCSYYVDEGDRVVFGEWVGFGPGEPVVLTETSSSTPFDDGREGWLTPTENMTGPCAAAAYDAARQARFEHGETRTTRIQRKDHP